MWENGSIQTVIGMDSQQYFSLMELESVWECLSCKPAELGLPEFNTVDAIDVFNFVTNPKAHSRPAVLQGVPLTLQHKDFERKYIHNAV